MKRYMSWGILPVVLFAVLAMFFLRGLSLDPQRLPSAQLNKPLPKFNLEQLEGGVFTPESLQGQPSILHVWASWCTTCAKEQVFLLQLAQEGLPLYGLNYKDDLNDARTWLNTWGNPYRLNGRDVDGHVAIDLGVYGTPETFLIDAAGIIRYRHVGALDAEIWKHSVLPAWRLLTRGTA